MGQEKAWLGRLVRFAFVLELGFRSSFSLNFKIVSKFKNTLKHEIQMKSKNIKIKPQKFQNGLKG